MAEVVNTREHPRVVVDAFVRVAGETGEQLFRTRDVSLSGLFLFTRVGTMYAFKVGSTLDIELATGDQGVRARVVVVRVVEAGSAEAAGGAPTGFGCRIVDLSDEDRAALTALLAHPA